MSKPNSSIVIGSALVILALGQGCATQVDSSDDKGTPPVAVDGTVKGSDYYADQEYQWCIQEVQTCETQCQYAAATGNRVGSAPAPACNCVNNCTPPPPTSAPSCLGSGEGCNGSECSTCCYGSYFVFGAAGYCN